MELTTRRVASGEQRGRPNRPGRHVVEEMTTGSKRRVPGAGQPGAAAWVTRRTSRGLANDLDVHIGSLTSQRLAAGESIDARCNLQKSSFICRIRPSRAHAALASGTWRSKFRRINRKGATTTVEGMPISRLVGMDRGVRSSGGGSVDTALGSAFSKPKGTVDPGVDARGAAQSDSLTAKVSAASRDTGTHRGCRCGDSARSVGNHPWSGTRAGSR